LTLYNTLIEKTSYDDEAFTEYRKQVAELFCMVGGISLFTLLISGMTAKPLLKWLGLATSENVRHKVIDNYKKQMKVKALKTYVRLLSQDRFKGVEFSLVREHVPFLRDITYDQLMVACEWYKNNTPQYMYQTPNLEHVIPYLYHSLPTTSPRRVEVHHPVPNSRVLTHRRASVCKLKGNYKWDNVFGSISSSTPEHTIHNDEVDSEALHEARLNFIEILKSAYHRQIKLGELDSNGELVYSLFQSLEFCEDAAARGLPLNDWEGTKIASATRVLLVDEFFRRMLIKVRHIWKRRRGNMAGNNDKFFDTDAFKVWLLVRQALAFVRAHSLARTEFEEHFCSMIPTSEEEKVIEESNAQCALAQADLDDIDREDVARIRGHKMCRIILNDAIKYIDELAHQELIPEKDAGETLDQLNEYIDYVTVCGRHDHDAKLDLAVQVDRLKLLPSTTLDEFKLWPVIDELSRRVEEEGERESETREVGSSLNSPLLDNVSSI